MIDKIYGKYFQKSRSFLYPALGIKRGKILPSDTYISIKGLIGAEDMKLICLFKDVESESFKQFEDQMLISNPLFGLLTGGTKKTWAIDSVSVGHFGVGPAPSHPDFDGYYPKWYAAASEEKTGAGMYDDRYTFKIQGFGFDMVTNGDVYVNTAHAGIAPFNDTTATNVGDYSANFPNQLGENWTLTEGSDTTITVTGNSMIGYWAGTRTYKIVELDSNKLVLGFQTR